MNGSYPLNHNRFRELGSNEDLSNKSKRFRDEDFISLPEIRQCDDHIPRYLVVSTNINKELTSKPISAYNVFQIEKGLNFISKEYTDVVELKSGDLLIKTKNLKAAEKFRKANYIDTIPVSITYHKALNYVQGKIFSKKIIYLSEDELIEGLKEQKVVEIRKIMKKEDDKLVPTGAAVITFDLIRRPEYLKLGWERVKINEYIPNPMRCKNCQKLGHTKNRCKNPELCRECGEITPHNPCNKKFCVNCSVESHASYESTCPSFLKHKAVLKIKIDKRCTIREAWKTYNLNPEAHQIFTKNNPKPTFANITKSTKNVTFEKEKQQLNNDKTTTETTNEINNKTILNQETVKQKTQKEIIQHTTTANKPEEPKSTTIQTTTTITDNIQHPLENINHSTMEIDSETENNLATPKRTSQNMDTQSPGSYLSPYSKAIYCDIKSQLGKGKTKSQNDEKK